jgi:hypothetical protein
MSPDLYKIIFVPVRDRILQRKNSLANLKNLRSSISFEGWLKIESICALNGIVDRVGNRGSDLILKNNLPTVELKASIDNLTKNYFTKSKNILYSVPVLFIAGKGQRTLEQITSEILFTIIGQEQINDELILGLVSPSDNMNPHNIPAASKEFS